MDTYHWVVFEGLSSALHRWQFWPVFRLEGSFSIKTSLAARITEASIERSEFAGELAGIMLSNKIH